ncbi:hypothetical protein SODALDRAFT_331777 [Sodiomyces alkalinus F11]|uniref:Uncharacterized protein n=1 Tax=Sodiomyces alkalinus (strain CBS 110278 / VKM F-3762 / F11) TaxID=1314773 RepID=A0A3N2PYR2_SODAK|nr:hypothetical protein SODALDRAFT_331777 [Sodiomyces alkalinus F11]ROT39673.1 hypothetical protein SODALDRAFT_331777 [Sodiomyces alkalinus F11]
MEPLDRTRLAKSGNIYLESLHVHRCRLIYAARDDIALGVQVAAVCLPDYHQQGPKSMLFALHNNNNNNNNDDDDDDDDDEPKEETLATYEVTLRASFELILRTKLRRHFKESSRSGDPGCHDCDPMVDGYTSLPKISSSRVRKSPTPFDQKKRQTFNRRGTIYAMH